MTEDQLAAGVARNNVAALDPAGWRLNWVYKRLIPTGSYFQTFYQVPPSAAIFRLDYLMIFWPGSPTAVYGYQQIHLELIDDRGTRFLVADPSEPASRQGVRCALFTTPGAGPRPPAAAEPSYRGMMPLGLEFPGRANIAVNLRGATETPEPVRIDLLLVGHLKNKVGP